MAVPLGFVWGIVWETPTNVGDFGLVMGWTS